MTDRPLQSIVHPADFSQAGLDAFAHALRLAVAAKSHFHILHIDREDELADWVQFPRVREMLAAWGMIAPDAPRSAVASELGLKVSKVIIGSNDPVRSVGAFVKSHPCDLLVLMIHARSAPRWLQGSVAEAAARRAHAPALFLREDQRGFVDRETGAISLKTILLPIDGTVPHGAPGGGSRPSSGSPLRARGSIRSMSALRRPRTPTSSRERSMCGRGPSSKQLFRSPRRSARISSPCPRRVATAYSTRFAAASRSACCMKRPVRSWRFR